METNSIIILAGRKYDGYLWYSDEQQPRIYREKELGAEICSSDTPSIPFIIEGYLRSGNDSYSIKMTDGKYYIQHYNLESLDIVSNQNKGTTVSNSQCIPIEYLPNRFGEDSSIEKLCYTRIWKEESDPLCEGMNVLVPKEEIFIGFLLKEEKMED